MSILKVAKTAGVSHTTVSRVINNRPGVSPDAAQRVRQAMIRIGYTPPAVRRGRQAKGRENVKTGTVAMVIFGEQPTVPIAPVASFVLHVIESTLADKGWGLILSKVTDANRLPPTLAPGRVDGLLLYGQPPTEKIANQLRDLPSVWLLSQRRSRGYWGSRVQPDNERIGQMAADYLIDHDCRDLVFMHLDRSHLGFGVRANHFAQTALERNVNVTVLDDDRPGISAKPTDANWMATQVDRALALPNKPTGIYLPRVSAAGLLYKALRARGVEPGRDVRIITTDKDSILSALDPQPATIDVQPYAIGTRAAKLLLWQIQNQHEPVRTTQMVEPILVEPETPLSPLSNASSQ